MLREFIASRRDEILGLARLRVAARNEPASTTELAKGLPVFLDQLGEALRKASAHQPIEHDAIKASADQHGNDQFHQGLNVAQVVHGYGDLCQVISGLAMKGDALIPASEFQTLNLCLDDAIAGAVTAFGRHRESEISDEGTERLGMLAHEMRNVLASAVLSFGSIKRGTVAIGGSTAANLERSLTRLTRLIDSSLAEVRLDAGIQHLERIPLWLVIEEVEIGGLSVAEQRGLRLDVATVDRTLVVEADQQLLAAALANLVQNALKFTRPGTTIAVRTRTNDTRVFIDVEDACGGLPPGGAEELLKPFRQGGKDRSGVGLGLAICVKSMKALAGELHVRDLPGKGCIFTIDLPKQLPSPASIHDGARKPRETGPRRADLPARGR
jgi:signal transduction histidine kinase